MAASDYVPIFFKNRLHLAGRPQMGTSSPAFNPRPFKSASRSSEFTIVASPGLAANEAFTASA
ncbi:hypothetical protein M2192_009426 [Bradyrhizobium elkanii USDA 61]|nr:hypothetical protein [Bradyrhizobium elkanii]MCS3724900.1 hypothetical protein [Bradyrhizobium elkanii]MCS4012406.1 hypothetical protein [Bradyrhizobium elkanii USDA 61]